MKKRTGWIIFVVLLSATLAAEFFVVSEAHFGLDGTLFFHAWFGFAACAAIIAASKLLGFFLSRRNTYYGKRRD